MNDVGADGSVSFFYNTRLCVREREKEFDVAVLVHFVLTGGSMNGTKDVKIRKRQHRLLYLSLDNM